MLLDFKDLVDSWAGNFRVRVTVRLRLSVGFPLLNHSSLQSLFTFNDDG